MTITTSQEPGDEASGPRGDDQVAFVVQIDPIECGGCNLGTPDVLAGSGGDVALLPIALGVTLVIAGAVALVRARRTKSIRNID